MPRGPLSLQLALGFDMASHLVQLAHADMQLRAQQSQESVGQATPLMRL